MPRVSVIMPAYNGEKYIQQAIDSILGQTYRDFEFIILNDCSRDRTEDIIVSCRDERIVYIKNEKNMGVAATLNRGLWLAKGEYIARMDADDISLPQRLEKQVAYLDTHPEVAVLGTNVETFNQDGILHTGWSATEPQQMKVDLFFSCGLAHPSVMMRRDVVLGLGGYDLAYEGLEDYQLWCRVAHSHGVSTLPEVLFRYRVHSAQVTKNPSPEYKKRMQRLKAWQLEQLGMSEDYKGLEAYCRLCQGQRPNSSEELLETAGVLEEIWKANQVTREYAPSLLRSSFKSILLASMANLKRKDAIAVCQATSLVSRSDYRRYGLKQKIKRLLGR